MNQWRSPTAEKIYFRHHGLSVRSAGTHKKAKKLISKKDLEWADVILVMEQKHKNRLRSLFPGSTKFKEIHILEIPDQYQFMDPELIEELTLSVDAILFRPSQENSDQK